MSASDDRYNHSPKGRRRWRSYHERKGPAHRIARLDEWRERRRRELGWYEEGGMATDEEWAAFGEAMNHLMGPPARKG